MLFKPEKAGKMVSHAANSEGASAGALADCGIKNAYALLSRVDVGVPA
jgi:hypothetical protein